MRPRSIQGGRRIGADPERRAFRRAASWWRCLAIAAALGPGLASCGPGSTSQGPAPDPIPTSPDPEERVRSMVEGWLEEQRAADPAVEYRMDGVHVESLAESLHRARFELEVWTTDAAGLPHVARKEHTWLVRAPPEGPAVLLRANERPILAFPGTGPRIVCY